MPQATGTLKEFALELQSLKKGLNPRTHKKITSYEKNYYGKFQYDYSSKVPPHNNAGTLKGVLNLVVTGGGAISLKVFDGDKLLAAFIGSHHNFQQHKSEVVCRDQEKTLILRLY